MNLSETKRLQRLMDWLPPGSSYHDATATSLRAILSDLLIATRAAGKTAKIGEAA